MQAAFAGVAAVLPFDRLSMSMATASPVAESPRPEPGTSVVDPRAPRFGQAVTATGLLLGVGLRAPVFVLAIAFVLNTAVWSRWRVHPYRFVWRRLIVPTIESREDPEPAAPHRFATVVGAVGTLLAVTAFGIGFPLVGYVLTGAIAAAAGLAAVTGFCLGCRMYRSVSLFRRLDLV